MSELAKRLRELQRYELVYIDIEPGAGMAACSDPEDGEWLDVDDVPLAAIAELVEAVGRDLEPGRSIAQQILDDNRVGEAYDSLAQAMKEMG